MLRRSFFLLLLLSIPFLTFAQWDVTDKTVDFRNQVAQLKKKSGQQVPENIIAQAILDKKARVSLPMIPIDTETYESTIILGDHVSSYVLFEDVDWDQEVIMTITSDRENSLHTTYSYMDVKKSGRLMIGPFNGDIDIRLKGSKATPIIRQVYVQTTNQVAMELGFGASFECHDNINCEIGEHLNNEKRSVMRIRMVTDIGVALCTGTLLNNTSGDRSPIVLTAYHCIVPPDGVEIQALYDMWWFDFNFESLSCANPDDEPEVVAIQGAELLADWEDTDMMLLRITQDIPDFTNVYYAGWNRDPNYLADTTYMIHHPLGDIKKISVDNDKATIQDKEIDWNNDVTSSASSHIRNQFDQSTYQQGSSGSAIMDPSGHVLGQLHGGPLTDPECELGVTYCGRFSLSWDTGDGSDDRLRDWLDPIGSGQMILDGVDTKQNQLVRISGKLISYFGIPIANATVELSGDTEASVVTGSDGRFVIEGIDPSGSYELKFVKNTAFKNGLSVSDIIKIRNHIIGAGKFESDISVAAADVNQDGRISSSDIIQIRNVLVGRNAEFPNCDSWLFSPNSFVLDSDDFVTTDMSIDVLGFKMGDVNFSSNPKR